MMCRALGVAKKWTKTLNFKIFKWQAEIVVTLPSLNSKIFGFSHWLLNWPRTTPANFWVRAQRKMAQNGPKNAIFQNLLNTHPKLENAWNKCLIHHFGAMLVWKVVSVFGLGRSKSHFWAPKHGLFWWFWPKMPMFRRPKMGLRAPQTINRDNFLTPTSSQNGGIDICFVRFPILDEYKANFEKLHFLGCFGPFFFEHGPKNWLEMCGVKLRASD